MRQSRIGLLRAGTTACPRTRAALFTGHTTASAGSRDMLSRSAGYALAAAVLLGLGVLGAALYWWSPHATIRITTGPLGSNAERFISALIAVSKNQHSLVRFEPV